MKYLFYPFFFLLSLFPFFSNASNFDEWSVHPNGTLGDKGSFGGYKYQLVNGLNTLRKGVATLKPSPKNIAKILAGGAGAIAVDYALDKTLMGAIDWVLDPNNNSIVYTPVLSPDSPSNRYRWAVWYDRKTYYFSSVSSASSLLKCYEGYTLSSTKITYPQSEGSAVIRGVCDSNDPSSPPRTVSISASRQDNPNFDPNSEIKPISVPVSKVVDTFSDVLNNPTKHPASVVASASKIISDASQLELDDVRSGNSSVRPSDLARQLDASSYVIPESQIPSLPVAPPAPPSSIGGSTSVGGTTLGSVVGGSSTTTNPDGSITSSESEFELPVFCEWIPIVCEASATIIQLPNYISETYDSISASVSEFFSSDPAPFDDLGQFDDSASQSDKNKLSSDLDKFSSSLGLTTSSCPTGFYIDVPRFSTIYIDLSSWCPLMTLIKYLLHLGVLFFAFRIISNAVQEF